MAKYLVTLGDGRSLDVYAPSEAAALVHANHQETTRIQIMASRRLAASLPPDQLLGEAKGRPVGSEPPSNAVTAQKIKD